MISVSTSDRGFTLGALRRVIRGMLIEVQGRAGEDYMRRYEDPMTAVQGALRDRLGQLPREDVVAMGPGSAELSAMVQDALDDLEVTDERTRELIARPLRMVPPVALLPPAPIREALETLASPDVSFRPGDVVERMGTDSGHWQVVSIEDGRTGPWARLQLIGAALERPVEALARLDRLVKSNRSA